MKRSFRERILYASIFLGLCLVWFPVVHLFFLPDVRDYRQTDAIAPEARRMLNEFLYVWHNPETRDLELARMAKTNPEWDFMSRTFLVLALSNAALQDSSLKANALETIDTIIDHTLALERERGMYHFLLGYAQESPWECDPPRSQFLDGEIALMLAARCFVEDRPDYRESLRSRVDLMVARMEQSPVLSAESYPDECWLFCNAIAVVAIRASDVLNGTDHGNFLHRWMAVTRACLTDPETGLLIAAYTFDGSPHPAGDGPEGTTVWLMAHMLEVLDPVFAADQYARARRELGRSLLGFGYAREWPESHTGAVDVDSGPVIPLLNASPGSSGLAVFGTAAFEDEDFLRQLLASLRLGGFPVRHGNRLTFRSAGAIGNSVVVYGLVEGPLWRAIREGRRP